MINKDFNNYMEEEKRTLESIEMPKHLIPLVLQMLKSAYLRGQVAVYEKWDDDDDDNDNDDTREPIPQDFIDAWKS